GDPRSLVYRAGTESALDQLLNSDRPLADALQIRDWQPPRFPLTGGAIVARGVKAGPEVARLMKQVEQRWIAEDFPGEDRVSALADEAVAQALHSVSSAQASSRSSAGE
ncbi:MAG TPA: CCA tRNA nucleotidyltransferase, partial [Sphingomonas sp.]|nr:CCA tRNA nucleotidyltransferase [Sphingomonas sp.]